MRSLIVMFSASLILMNITFADEISNQGMQRAPGKVECDHKVKICSYTAQNITGRELIAKLNANLFYGSILSSDEGYLTQDGLKKINFYIFSKKLKLSTEAEAEVDAEENEALKMFIAVIPLLDRLEDFDPSDLVLLTTDIFSMTEGGLSNFEASLVKANAPASEIADWVIASALGGPTGIALKVGTNLLSSLLGSSKIKEESSKVTTINQLIPNQAGINYSNTSKIYISPTNGVVKEEQAGLSIGGTVSISARDNELILIKDYNLSYGVVENITQGERVNILSINNPQLYLTKGVSSLLVSSVIMDQVNRTEYSAVSFGKKKSKLLNKLMIVTRAEAINFKDFIKEMRSLRLREEYQTFTKEEKDKFASSDIQLKEVLNHVKPYAFFTTSGDRVLGFKLDTKDARINNIKQNIEIKVKKGSFLSPGLKSKDKKYLSVENLMKSGYQFGDLSIKAPSRALVKIKFSLTLKDSEEGVTKVLEYNPTTNRFFE